MTDADNAANDQTQRIDLSGSRRLDAPAGASIPRPRDSAEGALYGSPTVAPPTPATTPADSDVEDPPGSDADGEEIAPGSHRRRRSPWKTLAIVVGVLVLVCTGSVLGAGLLLANRYDDAVAREDILSEVPKPAPPADEAKSPLNFLVLGSDSRAEGVAVLDESDGSRSDTIMIVHINAKHDRAFIFSVPRDSYVDIPAGGNYKGGKNKINAAFAFGGAKLAAKTVYELTKIPLNGAMIVNFGGIHRMVAEVGTVNVCVPYEVRSMHTQKVWTAGCHDMGPEETEDFMRQRKSVPGGDFGRIHDQQLVVKALASKIANSDMLSSPLKLDSLIVTAATSVTVDQNMNLRDLIFALKDIKPDNMHFATTPYSGTMNTDAGSSVQLDMAKARVMFQAVIDDKAEEWLAANPQKDPSE